MSDYEDAISVITEEIGDHWNEMIQATEIPAIRQDDGIHTLDDIEADGISARDWGVFDIGVLRGLELARAAVDEAKEDSEE